MNLFGNYSFGFIFVAIAIVHFIRRRPESYWLWIIIMGGGLGALIYIVVEVLPDLGLLRQSFQVFSHQAAIAGAGGTASMAAAPFPIDLTAPAFGAAMMTNAMSYLGMLSAERGAILPNREMMVRTHPEEMILPQHISNFVVQAASNASAGGQRGGDTNHFVFAPTVQTFDAEGVDRVLKDHRARFHQEIHDVVRRLNY